MKRQLISINKADKYLIGAVLYFIASSIVLVIVAIYNPHNKIVSERLTECESKGGKYSIYYNQFTKEYSEDCNVAKTEIEGF